MYPNYRTFLRAAVFTLAVQSGTAWAAPEPVQQIVIDFAKAKVQDTTASCGSFVLKNLGDKDGYSLWVRGTVATTCHFEAEGLAFHYPPNFSATMPGTTTLFSFIRSGADVVVAWSPGY